MNTYLLLHPSSAVIVEKIFKNINDEGFEIKEAYRIKEWNKLLDNLYKNTYLKAETIKMHVHAHAFLNNYLYGNSGILLILYKNEDYNTMIKDTLNLKKSIRSSMNKTKDGTISIRMNLKGIFSEGEYKELLCSKINDDEKVFLSYVHCPDTREQYIEDFSLFNSMDLRRLDIHDIESILKYHSYL